MLYGMLEAGRRAPLPLVLSALITFIVMAALVVFFT